MTDHFFIANYLGVPKQESMRIRQIYVYCVKNGFRDIAVTDDCWKWSSMELAIIYMLDEKTWFKWHVEQTND